MNLNGPSSLV